MNYVWCLVVEDIVGEFLYIFLAYFSVDLFKFLLQIPNIDELKVNWSIEVYFRFALQ